MDIDVIVVPYDSGHRGRRMGAGPEALLAAGLLERLERAGHSVTCSVVEPPAGVWSAEIRTAFDLAAGVAERVRAARAAGRFPLVLTGNCGAAVGVVAGLGSDATVVWCDAHGDLHTPETTTSGFLDGMGLAILTGRCWGAMAAKIPGFAPVPDSAVWLAGARDLDPAEQVLLERSVIRRVAADAIGPVLAAELRAALAVGAPLYLHLDLDVLDVAEGRANAYAAPGGVTVSALHAFCAALGTPAALTLSAYDPSVDVDGRVRGAALAAVEALLGQSPAPSATTTH